MPEVGGDGDGHLGVQALPVEPVQRDTPVESRCNPGISVFLPMRNQCRGFGQWEFRFQCRMAMAIMASRPAPVTRAGSPGSTNQCGGVS